MRKKKSGGGSWGGTIAGWGIDMNQSTSQSTNKTSVDVADSSSFVNKTIIIKQFLSTSIYFFYNSLQESLLKICLIVIRH